MRLEKENPEKLKLQINKVERLLFFLTRKLILEDNTGITQNNLEDYRDYIIQMSDLIPELYSFVGLIEMGNEDLLNHYNNIKRYVDQTYFYCFDLFNLFHKKNGLI